ncbi:MAG: lipid-A-disaccharide synthase [Pseudomonadales bacterium]|nr:lipid-A-disaccharide synthase [Pseudomonadales bacterium]
MRPLTIAILAGEPSGDNLGAPLIRAIKAKHPDARFVGIGGAAMIREGLESWVDMERLSVNGFVDPIKRLPELYRILMTTRDRVVAEAPDCFVGVDFNFFNLLLERMLRNRGVKTVHYVSPTVWAWRKWRIRSIAKSVDLMLALYPFETGVYEENGIDVAFVGHPKADEIDPSPVDKRLPREQLGLPADAPVVAVLPGSRGSEVAYTGPDFLNAAVLIAEAMPDARFVIPSANEKRKAQLEEMVARLESNISVAILDGDAMRAMQAADVVLVNSGTATLEAMLLKKPMVMSYRLGAMTYAIVSRLVTTPYFALPNILARRALVPELIQDRATPEALSAAVLDLLRQDGHDALFAEFDRIHTSLRRDAAASAAEAILSRFAPETHGAAD